MADSIEVFLSPLVKNCSEFCFCKLSGMLSEAKGILEVTFVKLFLNNLLVVLMN